MLGALLPWESHQTPASLASEIAAKTAREIVELRREPGEPLTEADLIASFGGSRSPAREAMVQLQNWGLVRLLPKKGGVVTTVSPTQRRELLAVRTMFEHDAVTTIARSPERLGGIGEHLTAHLERQREAKENGDHLSFAAADFAFHAAMIEAAGNTVVIEMLRGLAPRLARLTFMVASARPERLAEMLTDHETLAALASAGDLQGFTRLLTDHVSAGHFPSGSEG